LFYAPAVLYVASAEVIFVFLVALSWKKDTPISRDVIVMLMILGVGLEFMVVFLGLSQYHRLHVERTKRPISNFQFWLDVQLDGVNWVPCHFAMLTLLTPLLWTGIGWLAFFQCLGIFLAICLAIHIAIRSVYGVAMNIGWGEHKNDSAWMYCNLLLFGGLALSGIWLLGLPIHFQRERLDPALLLVQGLGASAVVLLCSFVVYWVSQSLTSFLNRLARRSLGGKRGPGAHDRQTI
jgi:hypothetical protein